MIRAVIDTNLLVSGMLWSGPPNQLYKAAAQQKFIVVTSEVLINELYDTLQKAKLARAIIASGKHVDELITEYRTLAEIVEPTVIPTTARDKDDDAVLGCAIGGKADVVVTGDKDLLVLESFRDIPILDTNRFLELLHSE